MILESWLAYISTVLILMSTPGPSHMLMLSNSMSHGIRRSAATAAGDLSANVLQMIVAAAGLVSVIHTSREFFLVVKWAGVAYLVYLGLALIVRRAPGAGVRQVRLRSQRSLFAQGFVTSAANPKAVIFFASLFPLFIDPALPVLPQCLVLGVTYLIIDGIFLLSYGGFAQWIAVRFSGGFSAYGHRVSGSLLILAAVILGMKDVRGNT